MAENKKVYSIVINGVKESSDAVQVLLDKLVTLEERLSKLSSAVSNVSSNVISNPDPNVQSTTPQVDTSGNDKQKLDVLNKLSKSLDDNKKKTSELVKVEKDLSKTSKDLSNDFTKLKSNIDKIKSGVKIDTNDVKQAATDINDFNNKLTTVEQSLPSINSETQNFSTEILNAAEGLKSFNTNAEDVDAQVNSLSDALKELALNGKKNTDEYALLEKEFVRLRKTSKEVDEELEAMADRSRGLTQVVQSFKALVSVMQVGAGVAGLFGGNQEKIEKSMQKMVSLMSIAQGVQEIYNQAINKTTIIGKAWTLAMVGAEKVMSLFTKSTSANAVVQGVNATATTTGAVATTGLATATKLAAVAMKVLKVAIAATGIGLLVIGIGELVGWLMSFETQADKVAKSAEAMKNALGGVNNETEAVIKNHERLERSGEFTYYDRITEDARAYGDNLKKTVEYLQTFSQQLEKTFNGHKFSSSNVNIALDKFSEEMIKLIAGTEDSDKALKDYTKDIAYYLTQEIKRIDTIKAINGQTDEYLKSLNKVKELIILINQENIDFDKILGYDGFNDMIKSYSDGFENLLEATKKIDDEHVKLAKASDEAKIASMEDGLEKEIALLYKAADEELEQYRLKSVHSEFIRTEFEKIKIAITEKYAIQENKIRTQYAKEAADKAKEHARELAQIERSIQNNKLSILNDGLDKTIKQLELQRKEEIDAARETGIRVGEQTIAINDKYDKEILDAKKKFFEDREKLIKDYNDKYSEQQRKLAQMGYDTAQTSASTRGNNEVDAVTFDTDAVLQDNVNKQKEYFNELINLKSSTAETLANIDTEELTFTTDNNVLDENARHEEMLKSLKTNLDEGKILQEQYDDLLQKETIQHSGILKSIEIKSQQELNDIIKKKNDINKKAYEDYFKGVSTSYKEYLSNIKSLEENARQTNDWGIINYNKTKSNLNKVKSEYDNILNGIQSEYDKLQQSFDSKQIDFNQFKDAKKDLKDLEKATKDAANNTQQSLEDLTGDMIGSINNYVQIVGQAAMQLMASINEFQSAALDAQQETIDKEADELDKALQSQQDIVQSHKDKIDSIEDELANSRGDRRQHLIDQLNAEKQAQANAMAEEQKIQKKKEANEKKQDALAKKRRQQEKKAAITQAIISGALAAANGFATQPFVPVGIAMGALAIALTSAQVALISKQKYAKGGVLEGKPHSMGGIKTPFGELEGGEYVTRKTSTRNNIELLEFVNQSERRLNRNDMEYFFNKKSNINIPKKIKAKYAEGGTLPVLGNLNLERQTQNTVVNQDNRPVVVQVVDIINRQDNIRKVETLAGL